VQLKKDKNMACLRAYTEFISKYQYISISKQLSAPSYKLKQRNKRAVTTLVITKRVYMLDNQANTIQH